ncbi:hypothetical protein ACFVJR_27900 [Nocardia salmonicida]|uniref:hypothetical protein n=1 Tax=Nocardia salmonicida TaxID=53431 RepID=UPI0036401AD5
MSEIVNGASTPPANNPHPTAEEAVRLLQAAAAASGRSSRNHTIAKAIATTVIGRFLIEGFDYLLEHDWFGLLG